MRTRGRNSLTRLEESIFCRPFCIIGNIFPMQTYCNLFFRRSKFSCHNIDFFSHNCIIEWLWSTIDWIKTALLNKLRYFLMLWTNCVINFMNCMHGFIWNTVARPAPRRGAANGIYLMMESVSGIRIGVLANTISEPSRPITCSGGWVSRKIFF